MAELLSLKHIEERKKEREWKWKWMELSESHHLHMIFTLHDDEMRGKKNPCKFI